MSNEVKGDYAKIRTGYILVPVRVEYKWSTEPPYSEVLSCTAPTAEDCELSYSKHAIVYKSKAAAFKDYPGCFDVENLED